MQNSRIVEVKKQIRKSSVLNLIRERGPISRAQISQWTLLNLPTVTHIVHDLKREGLVVEDRSHDSTVGRPAAHLRIEPTGRFALGLDLQLEHVRCVICDLDGSVVDRSVVRVRRSERADPIGPVRRALEETLSSYKLSWDRIEGVGVGAAGDVDPERLMIYSSPVAEEWNNVSLREILAPETPASLHAANDLHAAAMGEYWFGSDREVGTLLYLHLGRYIGSALLVDGRPYASAPQPPGGLGHIVVQREGVLCYCGARGCLETVASEEPIVSAVVEGTRQGIRSRARDLAGGDPDRIDIGAVLQAAEMGDSLAFNALDRAGRYVGEVLANAVHLLNPDRIVIGGGLRMAGEHLFGAMRREIKARVTFGWNADHQVGPSRYGDDVVAVGAAALVFERMFRAQDLKDALYL